MSFDQTVTQPLGVHLVSSWGYDLWKLY